VFTEMATATYPSNRPSAAANRLLRGFLAAPWLHPLNDAAAIDDLVGFVSPVFSLTRIRARVIEARRETANARTLVLAPNRLWPGHTAGQHVLVQAEIGGRRVQRTFSLSSPPRADGCIEITVKRREGGHVSVWWNEDARVGDVVTLSAPAGDFVLPETLPPRLVMISAGSGITPVMAMLRALDEAQSKGAPVPETTFLHVARSPDDAIFSEELAALASRNPWLHLTLRFTSESGRLGENEWSRLAREAGDAPAFVCGPSAFMESARGA
jgi:ferredoxin-NADP reductase